MGPFSPLKNKVQPNTMTRKFPNEKKKTENAASTSLVASIATLDVRRAKKMREFVREKVQEFAKEADPRAPPLLTHGMSKRWTKVEVVEEENISNLLFNDDMQISKPINNNRPRLNSDPSAATVSTSPTLQTDSTLSVSPLQPLDPKGKPPTPGRASPFHRTLSLPVSPPRIPSPMPPPHMAKPRRRTLSADIHVPITPNAFDHCLVTSSTTADSNSEDEHADMHEPGWHKSYYVVYRTTGEPSTGTLRQRGILIISKHQVLFVAAQRDSFEVRMDWSNIKKIESHSSLLDGWLSSNEDDASFIKITLKSSTKRRKLKKKSHYFRFLKDSTISEALDILQTVHRLHQSGQAHKQQPNTFNAFEDTALAAPATHPLKAIKLAPVPADTVLKRMDSIMVDRVLHNVSVSQFFNLFVKSDTNHPDKHPPITPDAFMLKWFAENQKYNVKLGEWKTLEDYHKRKWCGESYRHYRVRNSIREQFELCNFSAILSSTNDCICCCADFLAFGKETSSHARLM